MKELKIPPTRLGTFIWANNIDIAPLCKDVDVSMSFFSQVMWGKRSSESLCEKIASILSIPIELIYEGPLKRGRPKSKSV